MANPAHEATSVADALAMLDARIPLTHAEKSLIVQSLYDLGFREGARQGRLAGVEATRAEYEDTTTAIREHLTQKAKVRDGLS